MSSQQLTRVEKAAATRTRVLDAARSCFLSQEYAATTTRQIAGDAGVTERTVYNLAANKSDLLRQVLLTYVFDQDYGPLLDRKNFAPVLQASSPEVFLTRFAGWVTRLHQRTAAMAEMVRAAAAVDPGAAEIWSWGNSQQVTDCRQLTRLLNDRGWLRSDLIPEDASGSLAVLTGHETYWRLVVDQQWSRRRYRAWLRRHCALDMSNAPRDR